jgi:hypothetical protein
MPTQKLWVRGLAHEDEARISELLKAKAGVLYASASHQDECVEVEFDDDLLCQDELRDVLVELGYEVRLAG